MNKKQLRSFYKQQRRCMDKSVKTDLDAKIAQKLLDSEMYKACDDLLVYVSFGIEVDTLEIIRQAFAEKNVYCPRCVEGTNIMEFYKVSSFADLQQGSYGILEPQINSDTLNGFGKNAICVVPALSYDKKGYRLGFGKGYYDRFLSGFDGVSVGICYDNCLIDELPSDKFDICVDHLITENKSVSFGLRKEEIYG